MKFMLLCQRKILSLPNSTLSRCFDVRYQISSIRNKPVVCRAFKSTSGKTKPDMNQFKIGVQGAPFDLGQCKRGVAIAPDAIRESDFIEVLREVGNSAAVGIDVKDYNNIDLDSSGSLEKTHLPQKNSHLLRHGDVPIKNIAKVAAAARRIAESTVKIHQDDRFCLTLGGDHSIAIGTIVGTATVHEGLGVIWLDAHSDINTTMTTASGNMHGMPLPFLLREMQEYFPPLPEFSWLEPCFNKVEFYKGHFTRVILHGSPLDRELCISARDLVYIGLRDVEPDEKEFIKKLNIKAYSMADVDKDGINEIIRNAIQYMTRGTPTRPIHVSFDVDCLDDMEIPCTGTPVPGGLTLREGMHVMEALFESTNMVSMDLVEFNPRLGSELEVQRTVKALKEILFSSFGYDRGGMPPLR